MEEVPTLGLPARKVEQQLQALASFRLMLGLPGFIFKVNSLEMEGAGLAAWGSREVIYA